MKGIPLSPPGAGASESTLVWSLDLVSDTSAQGRVLRANDRGRRMRESLAIEADASLTSRRATAALERVLDDGPSPD